MILLPIIFYMICTWWSLVGPCFWIIIFIMYVFSRVLNEDSSCGHNFLDGIASPSPSTYPCQSVGESVIDSFRLEIAIASPSFASLFQKSFKLPNSNAQTQIILYHILTISFLHPPTGVRLFLLYKQLSAFRKQTHLQNFCLKRIYISSEPGSQPGRCPPHFILKLAILLLQAQL